MANKKVQSKKTLNGFAIQFMPYSEIKNLSSTERIKKILEIVLGSSILIVQGRLKPEEELRLTEDTMAMVGHIKTFKGIEIAVISPHDKKSSLEKLKYNLATKLSGADLASVTLIGPVSVIKEIKQNPRKIELLLN